VRQVIGKALEEGVLRKEDEAKYKNILVTMSDPVDVVATKLDGLAAAVTKEKQRQLDAREDAGYDVSRFRQRMNSVTVAPRVDAVPPPASGLVPIIAPDGQTRMIPSDQVDEAIRRGGKRAGG